MGKAWRLLREAVSEWSNDNAARLGAALAYYSVFSLAPLLLIAIGLAGLFRIDRAAAQRGIVQQIGTTVGEPAAKAVDDMVRQTGESGQGSLATAVGLAVLVFGATGVFVELQSSLNTIWKVQPKPGRAVWTIIRERFLSLAVVLGTCFLLLISLVVSAVLAAAGEYLSSALPGGEVLWKAVNAVVSFASVTLLFALILKLLPDVIFAGVTSGSRPP